MFARHNLVWLTAEGWNAAHAFARADPARDGDAADAADAGTAALERWRLADWPLVARRRDADAAADEACIGLALPPDAGGIKRRIALRVPAAGVAKTAPPLALAKALALLAEQAAAPAAWQPALAALRDDAVGLDLRVYGSLALQALTGLSYLRAGSDIDLLLQPHSDQQLRAGLALFGRHAAALPLDGEIVFPRGEAVAWKEWAAAQASGARVLVKEHNIVRLMPPELLAATLRAA